LSVHNNYCRNSIVDLNKLVSLLSCDNTLLKKFEQDNKFLDNQKGGEIIPINDNVDQYVKRKIDGV